MADLDQPRLPLPHLITGGKRRIAETGTALAIIDKIQGGGSIPVRSSWGGARNRRDRTSLNLTRKQCEGLIAAADFAERTGLAFNRHWTVHYESAGVAEIDAPVFIGNLLKLVRDYATRKLGVFTAVWVRENGEGKGGHVHILMHLPPGRTLRGRTSKWVRLAGGTSRAKVSKVVSIGGAMISADMRSEHYRHNLATVLAYVLKGADREAGEAIALPRSGEGGLIIGKRCGWSQNIGESARLFQAPSSIGAGCSRPYSAPCKATCAPIRA